MSDMLQGLSTVDSSLRDASDLVSGKSNDNVESACMSNETMESETRSYSMCDDDVKDMLDDGIGASNSDEIAERVGKETYLRRDEGKDREVECTLTEIGKKATVQCKDSEDSHPSTQVYEEEKSVSARVQMETEEAKEDNGVTHTDDLGGDEFFRWRN